MVAPDQQEKRNCPSPNLSLSPSLSPRQAHFHLSKQISSYHLFSPPQLGYNTEILHRQHCPRPRPRPNAMYLVRPAPAPVPVRA